MKMRELKTNKERKKAINATALTIFINTLLAIFKLIAGIIGKSGSVISDAVHSSADTFNSFMTAISFYKKEKKDKKTLTIIEGILTIVISLFLILTCFLIGYAAVKSLLLHNINNITKPSLIAFIATSVSIIIKEVMYWYTNHLSHKLANEELAFDAKYHRTDVFSSIIALIAIIGSLFYPFLDLIGSAIICIFILSSALTMIDKGIKKIKEN